MTHSHETMELIKVPYVLDGDLAVTLINLISSAADNGVLEDLVFCGHTEPKLRKFFDTLEAAVDIENRPEE